MSIRYGQGIDACLFEILGLVLSVIIDIIDILQTQTSLSFNMAKNWYQQQTFAATTYSLLVIDQVHKQPTSNSVFFNCAWVLTYQLQPQSTHDLIFNMLRTALFFFDYDYTCDVYQMW